MSKSFPCHVLDLCQELIGLSPAQRFRASFFITKEESILLDTTRQRLGAETNTEVIRLALVWLVDETYDRVIECRLSDLTTKIPIEVETSGQALNCLNEFMDSLKLRTPAEVVRVAINNFCRLSGAANLA